VGLQAFPVPADCHRPPPVIPEERREHPGAHLVKVPVMDKQLTSRSPVVISRTLSVVPQDIRARPKERGLMRMAHCLATTSS